MNPLHPVLLWSAICGMGAAVLLAAWAVVWGDRARGRERCPGCWYDMGGAPSLTCPECGRAARSERGLLATRRRWRAAAGAVVGGAGIAVALAATGHWVDVLRAVLPTWRQTARYDLSGCTVRVYAERFAEDGHGMHRVIVRGGGRRVLDISEWTVDVGYRHEQRPGVVGFNEDITGDGVPDLIISTYSGGAHCCFTYYILRLGPNPALIATLNTKDYGADFVPTETPGLRAFVSADPTFTYWHECFAASPAPRFVMVPDHETYRLAPERMAAGLPPRSELDSLAAELRAEERLDSRLWGTMLNLIYSGHQAEAWAFFDAAWPAGVTDTTKDQFLAEFKAQLATSPCWPALRSFYASAEPRD